LSREAFTPQERHSDRTDLSHLRREVATLEIKEFLICRQGRDMHWVVRLDSTVYGAYLNKEQALLDAIDAARDTMQSGREARVLLRERRIAVRIY
jgi:hypothetical protein